MRPPYCLAVSCVALLAGCGDPCADEFHLSGASKLGDIQDCAMITGGLTLADVGELVLPNLEHIEGDILHGPGATTRFSLPKLRTVSGSVQIHTFGALDAIELPVLERVGGVLAIGTGEITAIDLPELEVAGTLVFSRMNRLVRVSIPKLTTLDGTVTISVSSVFGAFDAAGGELTMFELPALRSVELPALTSVGSLRMSTMKGLRSLDAPTLANIREWLYVNDSALEALSLPALVSVEKIAQISNNAALASITFPALTTVTGHLQIISNALLTSISAPTLRTIAGALQIEKNATLIRVDLPALESADLFQISENPRLSTCEAKALRGRIRIGGGVANVFGNLDDELPGCP